MICSNEAKACNRDPFHVLNRFCQVAPRFRVSALTCVRLESGGDARYLRSVREGDGIYREGMTKRQNDKEETKLDEKDKDKEQWGGEGATPRIERDRN